jgi:transposase
MKRRRARLILLWDGGQTWAAIRDKLDCTDSFIDRWRKRFVQERLAGLFSRDAGGLATTLTPVLEARILEWSVKRKPRDGSTHWSTRKLGAQLNVSHMMIARVWRKHALRPHRCEGYIASNDPDFEADIVANQPRGKEIHVIADNLSVHKSQPVKDVLENHAKVHLHFTPTYSSWLNQVELWFAKIEREVIARGVFNFRSGSQEKTHALYPSVQQKSKNSKVEILRSKPANYS